MFLTKSQFTPTTIQITKDIISMLLSIIIYDVDFTILIELEQLIKLETKTRPEA